MAGIRFGRADGGQASVTATGTAAATATAITAMVNLVTTAAGEAGVKLPQDHPPGSPITLANVGTTTVAITVYPPTTAGTINGTASYSIAADKAAVCFSHENGLDYTVVGA